MTNQTKTNHFNNLINLTFTKVNRLFVLLFKNKEDRTSFSKYYVPKVEVKDFNVLIEGKSFFDVPVKNEEFTDKNADLTINNSQSFKYKAALLGKTADAVNNTNSSVKEAKIVVPLKYLSNFWRSLEMQLINCKVYLELNWIEDSILSSAGNTAKFAITDAK